MSQGGCYGCGYDGPFERVIAPRPSKRKVRICPACLRLISKSNPAPQETSDVV